MRGGALGGEPDIARRADRILHRVRLLAGLAFCAVLLINGPVLHYDPPAFTWRIVPLAAMIGISALGALRQNARSILPGWVAYAAIAVDVALITEVGLLTNGPWGSMPMVLLVLVALSGLHLRYGPLLFAAACATLSFLIMDLAADSPVSTDRLIVHLTVYWLMALVSSGLVEMSSHLTTVALGRQRAWLELEHRFGRHLGPQVASLLVDSPDHFRVNQQREVTAMFADLSGFTALTESAPGEVVLETLDAYFSLLVRVAQEHGGWVDHFEGDGVLVIFNAPLDQPDHASRAVAAARAMMAETHRLSAARKAAGRPSLGLTVGLNSGEVHVGLVGGQERVQYTAIGDAMNVAFRLESQGGPGQVLIGRRTAELAGLGVIVFNSCRVKGKRLPVQYTTLGPDNISEMITLPRVG